MNSSLFMDKQVTGLSPSQNNDFIDFLNPEEDQLHHSNLGKTKDINDQILRSYNFQPIPPDGASRDDSASPGRARVSKSADSMSNSSNIRTYGSLDIAESVKITREKDLTAYKSSMVSEIDQTMMKHAEKMLRVLEGIGARLLQLESKAQHLESSFKDLKVYVTNNHGKTDGKLRQLENILREVQTGIQVLRDKQDIQEAQLQLAKLHVSKGDQQSENQNSTSQTDSAHLVSSSQQSHQSPPCPLDHLQSQQYLPLPPTNAPHPSLQQIQPQVQASTQIPKSQVSSIPPREPYHGQLPETAHMQYQLPPAQQPQTPFPASLQQFQSVPQLSQYSQPPQQQATVLPVYTSKLQPLSNHRPEESPYIPPQSYPPTVHQSPSITQPPSVHRPFQQFYNAPHNMYEHSPGRNDSGFSSGYGLPSGPNFADSYPYSGSHSQYGGSSKKLPQHSPASSGPSGGSGYHHLPTAQILPRSLPTSSSDGSAASSGGSENKVPVDDVVEKVAMMGFSRDQVRAAVRKLSENGQSVDLNVVLDKLMNEGEVQPQKGLFGR